MLSIRLTGQLTAHARTATGTDGAAWLFVQVGQPGGITAHARQRYGTGHAAQYAAANAASHLRAGATITVHAAGYGIVHTGAEQTLMLHGVDLIERYAPAPRHEPGHEPGHPTAAQAARQAKQHTRQEAA